VLDASHVVVENTFIRIITDRRHHALSLLSRRTWMQRPFGAWATAGLGGRDHAAVIARKA